MAHMISGSGAGDGGPVFTSCYSKVSFTRSLVFIFSESDRPSLAGRERGKGNSRIRGIY